MIISPQYIKGRKTNSAEMLRTKTNNENKTTFSYKVKDISELELSKTKSKRPFANALVCGQRPLM